MSLEESLRLAVKVIDAIDEKYGVERTPQFTAVKLIEECGELAVEVNLENIKGLDDERLEKISHEIADVLILIAKLSDQYGIDLEKSLVEKLNILKERHSLSLEELEESERQKIAREIVRDSPLKRGAWVGGPKGCKGFPD